MSEKKTKSVDVFSIVRIVEETNLDSGIEIKTTLYQPVTTGMTEVDVCDIIGNFIQTDPDIVSTALSNIVEDSVEYPNWGQDQYKAMIEALAEYREYLIAAKDWIFRENPTIPREDLGWQPDDIIYQCPSCNEPILFETWNEHRECPNCGLIVNPTRIANDEELK